MSYFTQAILKAISQYDEFAKEIQVITSDEASEVKKRALKAHLPQPAYPHMVSDNYIRIGCHYDDYFRAWIFDYLADKEDLILFFEDQLEEGVFKFIDGQALYVLLNTLQARLKDFFITNSRNEFLLFYDAYGCIYAAGEAKTWVNTRFNDIFAYLELEPQPLYLTDLKLQEWGTELIIPCSIDPQGKTILANLIFQGSAILNLQGRSSQGRPTEVEGILIGRKAQFSRQPRGKTLSLHTFIMTNHFTLEMVFKELIVQPVNSGG